MVAVAVGGVGLIVLGAMLQHRLFGGQEKAERAYIAPPGAIRNQLPATYTVAKKPEPAPAPPPPANEPPPPPLKLADLHPQMARAAPPERRKHTAPVAFQLGEQRPGDPDTLYSYRAPSNVGRALRAGSTIPAVLDTGINSDLPGSIAATVTDDLRDSETAVNVVVPRGTRVIGRYVDELAFGQRRVGVVWTRLVFPDGGSMTLGEKGMSGVDRAGYAGVTGEVDAHWGNVILSTVITTVLGAANYASRESRSGYGDALGQSAASETNRTVGRVIDKTLNVAPTIRVAPGSEVRIFVEKDLVLPPWRRG